MRIRVNGKDSEVADGLTVSGLIESMELNPCAVVVELNLWILPREEWDRYVLKIDDIVEIISFVGGG